jgi:transcriptional regulator with XRE-family HTH domain
MPKQTKFTHRKTFIRQWRHHRGWTLQRLADRLDMTHSHFSMLERGKRGYTQDTLEKVAGALNTDVASLLMRAPTDPDDIWSIWDRAKPGQRKQIVEAARAIVTPDT